MIKKKALIKSIELNDNIVPLETIIGTNKVRLLDFEEVLDLATGELEGVRLHCGVGQNKNGAYIDIFDVEIPTVINKLSEKEIAKCPYVELENACVVHYTFDTDKGIVHVGKITADDYCIIDELDWEVSL